VDQLAVDQLTVLAQLVAHLREVQCLGAQAEDVEQR
jgi:hypothetical protein